MLPTYTAQNEFSPKRKFLTSQIVLQYSLLYGKSQKGQWFYAGEVIADRWCQPTMSVCDKDAGFGSAPPLEGTCLPPVNWKYARGEWVMMWRRQCNVPPMLRRWWQITGGEGDTRPTRHPGTELSVWRRSDSLLDLATSQASSVLQIVLFEMGQCCLAVRCSSSSYLPHPFLFQPLYVLGFPPMYMKPTSCARIWYSPSFR